MIVTMVTVHSSKVVSMRHSVPHILVPVVQVIGVLTAVLNVRPLMATAKGKPSRKEKKTYQNIQAACQIACVHSSVKTRALLMTNTISTLQYSLELNKFW